MGITQLLRCMIMSNSYEKTILDTLISKYETSKSFTGSNQVSQRFKVRLSKLFIDYADHSKYDVFMDVNEAVDVLKRKGFVSAKFSSGKVYENIYLSLENLESIYKYLKRTPKSTVNNRLQEILNNHMADNEILQKYCTEQLTRLSENKPVRYFNDNLDEFEALLYAIKELMIVESEQFIRELSIRLFKDSKAFNKLQSKIENLLYEFGDFPEKDQILASFNLVSTPTYVNYKGAARITLSGQVVNLSALSSDIAISSAMLCDIENIEVLGNNVITIENLTSFHRFNEPDYFIIYLGGFHNKVRRDFIMKLYEQNPQKNYYHFGDIDAGGFRILEHLRNKTNVPFKPYCMDIDTLVKYKEFRKKLTQNDKSNLEKLLIYDEYADYKETINFMVKNDCKLEQEAVI